MSLASSKARVAALAEDIGWEAAEAQSLDGLEVVGGDGDSVATVYGNAAHLATPDDRAEFIAHARQDVPALLAVAEAAKAVMDNPDADEMPDDEWDPRFLTLRAALEAVEALL